MSGASSTRTLTARRLAGRRGRDDGSARRLRDALRQNIVAGAYLDGLLPGEAELMVAYGARRAAVREALSMLRRERLVERVQGIGTFSICEQRYASTFDEMHGQVDTDAVSRRARPQILERSVIAAPDAVARKLGIAPGEPVVLLEYLGFVDGVAVWLASNYVKLPQGNALLEAPFESEWYALLASAGLRVGGSEWHLSAVNADVAVADLLDVPAGTAVMLAEELIWDEEGEVYDFAVCYFRSDRHCFVSAAGRFAMREASA